MHGWANSEFPFCLSSFFNHFKDLETHLVDQCFLNNWSRAVYIKNETEELWLSHHFFMINKLKCFIRHSQNKTYDTSFLSHSCFLGDFIRLSIQWISLTFFFSPLKTTKQNYLWHYFQECMENSFGYHRFFDRYVVLFYAF